MDDPELHEAVDKLHQELEQADDLDDESRQQLEHLMGDIRTALDRQQAEGEEDESLLEQLNESIQRYEASHPSITAALQHALEILSGAGI
jgi:chromosome segregation ATPase